MRVKNKEERARDFHLWLFLLNLTRLLLAICHIHLHDFAHKLGQLWMNLIKVRFESRVVIDEGEQLVKLRSPEVIHVLSPSDR